MQVKHFFRLDVPELVGQTIDIICRAAVETSYQQAAERKIPEYSCRYLTQTNRNIIKMYVEPVDAPPRASHDEEPSSLVCDNLMPSTITLEAPAAVDADNIKGEASRNSLGKRNSSNVQPSSNRTPADSQAEKAGKKRAQAATVSQTMIPLAGVQNEEEEDRIVKFLREKKMVDEKQLRALQESNKKQSQQKKQPKEKKPIPVTYDYNGEIIKIKNAEPTNLVKGSLQSMVDTNIQLHSLRGSIQRQTVKVSNAGPRPAKDPKKKKWVEGADDDSEEEQRQTPLLELPIDTFDLPEGAKITTLNRTNQNTKRQLSSRELMDNFKNIKLSRSQYEKIRRIEQNNQAAPVDSKQSTSIDKKAQGAQKETKVKRRSISMAAFKPVNEKVVVSNEQLKQSYLHAAEQQDEPPSNMMITQPIRQTIQERDQQVQFLLKKQQPHTHAMSRTKTVLVLPEIKHKLGGTTLIAHKQRERVRNEKQLLVEIHRKFEDRLRGQDSPTRG